MFKSLRGEGKTQCLSGKDGKVGIAAGGCARSAGKESVDRKTTKDAVAARKLAETKIDALTGELRGMKTSSCACPALLDWDYK